LLNRILITCTSTVYMLRIGYVISARRYFNTARDSNKDYVDRYENMRTSALTFQGERTTTLNILRNRAGIKTRKRKSFEVRQMFYVSIIANFTERYTRRDLNPPFFFFFYSLFDIARKIPNEHAIINCST